MSKPSSIESAAVNDRDAIKPVPPAVRQSDSSKRFSVERAFQFADLAGWPFSKRLTIRIVDLLFFGLIGTIGLTTRISVEGKENLEEASAGGKLPIHCFWHDRILLSTWFFRRRRIVVMTSKSFDGEYIARFIQRFGYGAARGSSSRGGIGAVVEMVRLMRAGCPAGFTIDGPRGPRYEAKMGAVILAKKTGNPILPFSIAAQRFHQVKSWDRLQVPYPFTKALVSIGAPIFVSADSDDTGLENKRLELQQVLDGLVRRGNEWTGSGGQED